MVYGDGKREDEAAREKQIDGEKERERERERERTTYFRSVSIGHSIYSCISRKYCRPFRALAELAILRRIFEVKPKTLGILSHNVPGCCCCH